MKLIKVNWRIKIVKSPNVALFGFDIFPTGEMDVFAEEIHQGRAICFMFCRLALMLEIYKVYPFEPKEKKEQFYQA